LELPAVTGIKPIDINKPGTVVMGLGRFEESSFRTVLTHGLPACPPRAISEEGMTTGLRIITPKGYGGSSVCNFGASEANADFVTAVISQEYVKKHMADFFLKSSLVQNAEMGGLFGRYATHDEELFFRRFQADVCRGRKTEWDEVTASGRIPKADAEGLASIGAFIVSSREIAIRINEIQGELGMAIPVALLVRNEA
jgi:hypothetical protein